MIGNWYLILVLVVAMGVPSPAGQEATSDPAEFVAAARRGDEGKIRKSLLEYPSLVEATDVREMTALDWAAVREHWAIFRQLVAAGADVNHAGFDGGTVLHRLAHHEEPQLVRLLLNNGAEVDTQNQWGRTPLHVAARLGRLGVAGVLLDSGADVNAVTREGWTPLHVAYLGGWPEMVELLHEAGADPDLRDQEGRIPSEHRFLRPAAVSIDAEELLDYQGHYQVNENFSFKVWVEDGMLRLRDLGAVDLYPVGPDAFFAETEPWAVRFSRDPRGDVTEIEVQFLRRAEVGRKVEYPEYVGSAVCGGCHVEGEREPIYVTWLRSRHGSAYWRLATDWSLVLAHSRPHFRDLTDPLHDQRCLNCHTTATLDEDALLAGTFDIDEGVGCETCHGPGSLYANEETMGDRSAFLVAGGRIPDETTCQRCHRRPDAFSFQEWWPRIAHSGAAGG